MYEPTAQRFAACCSNAFFGYAEAAQAMWWAVAVETFDVCDRAVKAATPEAERKPVSWFNPNPNGEPHYGERSPVQAVAASPFTAFPFTATPFWATGFGAPAAASAAWPFGGAMSVSPFDVWFNMFPLRGGPAAWPMAFCMLSVGVPKAVAWPAAEANAAMMEAAEVASEQFKTVFASYRTDGGFAAMDFTSLPFQPAQQPITKLMAMSWPLGA